MSVVFSDEEWDKMVRWATELGVNADLFAFKWDPLTGEIVEWCNRQRRLIARADHVEANP